MLAAVCRRLCWLPSVVVCAGAWERCQPQGAWTVVAPGVWAVGRPTLHGGPVRLRPVDTWFMFDCRWNIRNWKHIILRLTESRTELRGLMCWLMQRHCRMRMMTRGLFCWDHLLFFVLLYLDCVKRIWYSCVIFVVNFIPTFYLSDLFLVGRLTIEDCLAINFSIINVNE